MSWKKEAQQKLAQMKFDFERHTLADAETNVRDAECIQSQIKTLHRRIDKLAPRKCQPSACVGCQFNTGDHSFPGVHCYECMEGHDRRKGDRRKK